MEERKSLSYAGLRHPGSSSPVHKNSALNRVIRGFSVGSEILSAVIVNVIVLWEMKQCRFAGYKLFS
jgi:hypothetical protein